MKPNFLQQGAKKILAGSLIFWLSGLLFVFCCDMPNMAAQASSETESCPLAKAAPDHCNKKKSAAAEENDAQFAAAFETTKQTFDCCILPNIFDKARKIEFTQQIAAAPATAVKISAPKFSVVKNAPEIPSIYRSPVLTRDETYLKNRVFRI
jgi:hypothetical protein